MHKKLEEVHLDEEEVCRFVVGTFTVARIHHKKSGWYTGVCRKVRLEEHICKMQIDPYITFLPRDPLVLFDPRYIGENLIASQDQARGTLVHGPLPFSLPNSRRVMPDRDDPSIFIIANDDETVVLSKRPEHVEEVRRILGVESL